MKVYKLFHDIAAARQAIETINEQMGFNILNPHTVTWGKPIEHPCTFEALVPYDPIRLAPCHEAFLNVTELTEEQAIDSGWYLGYFQGRFGKAKGKAEEIHFLYETLRSDYCQKPFPYIKALMFGLTSGCYSIKETLRKLSNSAKCKRCSREQEQWWQKKFHDQIERPGELLQYFYRLNNADKHDLNVPLMPVGTYYSPDRGIMIARGAEFLESADGAVSMSSEGFFDSRGAEKTGLRRIAGDAKVLAQSYALHTARWTVEFVGLPTHHLAAPIKSQKFLDVLWIIVDYYTNLVLEADEKFS